MLLWVEVGIFPNDRELWVSNAVVISDLLRVDRIANRWRFAIGADLSLVGEGDVVDLFPSFSIAKLCWGISA